MTPAEQAARAIVLAWANEDTYVGGEPTLREQERLTKRIAAALEQARREEMREHRQNTGCRLTHRLKTTPWSAIRARAQEGK